MYAIYKNSVNVIECIMDYSQQTFITFISINYLYEINIILRQEILNNIFWSGYLSIYIIYTITNQFFILVKRTLYVTM